MSGEDGNPQGDSIDPPADERRKPTIPTNLTLTLRAFADENDAKRFGDLVSQYVTEISRLVDLSRLDGITIAFDYEQALLDLDRGYETQFQLTPSREGVHGIAMTPGVLRDGEHKSHIIFDATYITALQFPDHELHGLALHALAHECGHVEVSAAFDKAFPGTLLRRVCNDRLDAIRHEVLLACWDEYAVCWISQGIGADPTSGYEETLVNSIESARDQANEHIKAYRLHGDVDQLLTDVWRVYGNLLKFACYFAGAVAGAGKTLADAEQARSAMEEHWFAPHYDKLTKVMSDLMARWGKWTDESEFERIANIFEDMVSEGGVYVTAEDGYVHANVPFTMDTLPG